VKIAQSNIGSFKILSRGLTERIGQKDEMMAQCDRALAGWSNVGHHPCHTFYKLGEV